MSKCEKIEMDFCGNVSSSSPAAPLSMDYFQYGILPAYSAWIGHFKEPVAENTLGVAYIRYLGTMRGEPTGLYGSCSCVASMQVGLLRANFDETLTYTGFSSLSKVVVEAENEYFGKLNGTSFSYYECSGFGQDGDKGSWMEDSVKGPSGALVYGFYLYSIMLGGGKIYLKHPAILTTDAQIMDNYLLFKTL